MFLFTISIFPFTLVIFPNTCIHTHESYTYTLLVYIFTHNISNICTYECPLTLSCMKTINHSHIHEKNMNAHMRFIAHVYHTHTHTHYTSCHRQTTTQLEEGQWNNHQLQSFLGKSYLPLLWFVMAINPKDIKFWMIGKVYINITKEPGFTKFIKQLIDQRHMILVFVIKCTLHTIINTKKHCIVLFFASTEMV